MHLLDTLTNYPSLISNLNGRLDISMGEEMNESRGSLEGIAEGDTKDMSLADFLAALISIQEEWTPKIQIK